MHINCFFSGRVFHKQCFNVLVKKDPPGLEIYESEFVVHSWCNVADRIHFPFEKVESKHNSSCVLH